MQVVESNSEQVTTKKVSIVLNGNEVPATEGERLINIINRHNIPLSSPCYHEALTETGHCGLCLVGARRHKDDKFTVVYACTATAKDGMEIDTNYHEAVAKRQELYTLYLLEHPLDCSKCDKIGNCFLHKFSSQTKFRGFSRIINGKLDESIYEKFSSVLLHDQVKCINCQRCVRFYRDILGEENIGMVRGDKGYREVTIYPGKNLEDNYSLNLVDLCPAGAFLSKSTMYQPAEWDLASTPSISCESSTGINTYVLHAKNKIYRIKARHNEFVNDYWITNSARDEHKLLEQQKRLLKVTYRGKYANLTTALINIVKLSQKQELAIVASGNMSLEDQFALSNMSSCLVSKIYFLRKHRKGDGFLISDDPTPNFNGAILNRLTSGDDAVDDLTELNVMIQKGQCKRILVLNEDIFNLHISYAIPPDLEIMYMGTDKNRTADRASITIPTTTVFEYTGTFINKDWRLQKFNRAVKTPNLNIFPMWYLFSLITAIYYSSDQADNSAPQLLDIWHDMRNSIDVLSNVDFENLDPKGILLKK